MVFWCLFNFTIKKVDKVNITLWQLLLGAISKKLGKKEVLFNCFDIF